MSIQTTINQAWSVAGILASQSPGLQARGAENRAIRGFRRQSERFLSTADEILASAGAEGSTKTGFSGAEYDKLTPDQKEEFIDLIGKSEELHKAAYETKPTPEAYQKLKATQRTLEALQGEQERARKSKEFAELVTNVGGM